MADILTLERARSDAEEPVRVEILYEDGGPWPGADGEPDPTQPYIMVRGRDAKRVRKARTLALARIRRLRGEWIEEGVAAGEHPDDLVAALALDPEVRIPQAAAGCVDWGHWTENGAPLEFTPENVERVLSFEFVLGQVERAMRNHADFFGDSSSD